MKLKSLIKTTTLLFVLTVITVSCKHNNKAQKLAIFIDNEWYRGDELLFRNDSAISFTNYDTIKNMATDIKAFPLKINDTSLIYTRYNKRGYFQDNKEFKITHMEKQCDTAMYDLLYINKKPKLILYTEPFPIVLYTKSEISLPETHHFNQVKFLISDYTIGDQIDRSLIKTRGIYNYPNYTIEDCEFIDNKDITFKIIGYNTIYCIERHRIEDYRIKEIVDVVSAKLGVNPEYRPMRQWVDDSDYEYEFYRWAGHGVQINLSRSKYIGSESFRTLLRNNAWTLTYDDSFLQAILVETYRNGRPQSSIIN